MIEDPIARKHRIRPELPPTQARPTVATTLSRLSIFRRTSRSAQRDLVTRVRSRCVGTGTRLIAPGQPADALFVLHRGRVRLYVHDGAERSMTLATLGPGDLFGDTAQPDREPLGIIAEALEQVTALVLPHSALMAHLDAHPETALPLLQEAARHLQQRTAQIASLALREVTVRLARTLVALAREQSSPLEERLVIRDRPTHRELAAMIGSRRETVSRALKAFTRDGLVSVQGRQLVLSPALMARVG